MKLWAISDLHVAHPLNREAVQRLRAQPDDWLLLAGDIGETLEHLRFVIETLRPRFRQLVWVPGNHELWTLPQEAGELRGEAKYRALVRLCRDHGVLTPEDPYAVFVPDGGVPHLIAPLFVLYDYSFCPHGMDPHAALAWAREAGVECADEHLLHPDPYPSRQAWCAARCTLTEARLEAALAGHPGPTVLVNHFPLLAELARLPMVPRFSIWCGSHRTRDWHRRYRAAVVVGGHLHIRHWRMIDGVRFEEVSLGYPRQWLHHPLAQAHLRQILPQPHPEARVVAGGQCLL